jgi:hypothetical protein
MQVKKVKTKYGIRYLVDGQLYTPNAYKALLEGCSATGNCFPNFKPLHSEALAVHPTQIQEARDVAKAKGVPTDFDSSGRPIFTSSRHFREYAKRHGFRHKGYC